MNEFEQWYRVWLEQHRWNGVARTEADFANVFRLTNDGKYANSFTELASAAFSAGGAEANQRGPLRQAIAWILRNPIAHPNNVKSVCESAVLEVAE